MSNQLLDKCGVNTLIELVKQKIKSLASVAITGDYNDLENKPEIPTVPTNISSFDNDAGYLTSETPLSKGTSIGEGNAVTDISVLDHEITLTKGNTFVEQSTFTNHCPIIEDTRTSSSQVIITGNANFNTLVDGLLIILHCKYNWSSGAPVKINLTKSDNTLTGEKFVKIVTDTLVWGNLSLSNCFFREGRYIPLIWNAGLDAWLMLDSNDYSKLITQAEIDAGTSTSTRVITPKLLRDNFYTETEINNMCPLIEDTRSSAVATITGVAPFASLVDGQRINLHFNQHSAANTTLKLTLSGGTETDALPIYTSYRNSGNYQIDATVRTRAGAIKQLIYNATSNSWHTVGDTDNMVEYSKIDNNTIETGTSTTGYLVTAKVLRDNFYTKTETENYISNKCYTAIVTHINGHTNWNYLQGDFDLSVLAVILLGDTHSSEISLYDFIDACAEYLYGSTSYKIQLYEAYLTNSSVELANVYNLITYNYDSIADQPNVFTFACVGYPTRNPTEAPFGTPALLTYKLSWENFGNDGDYVWNKQQVDITELLDGKLNTLISGTNIKTINNESILGSGNISVASTETDPIFSASPAANITSVDITNWNDKANKVIVTNVIPQTGLLPNTIYEFGTTDTVNVTLDTTDTSNVAKIYFFTFTALTANCTVTLPVNITLGNDYSWDMAAGRKFEVSIVDNVALVSWSGQGGLGNLSIISIVLNSTNFYPDVNGVVDLGTVLTLHLDISGKQDVLVSGTSIKTVNSYDLLGSGNLNLNASDIKYTGNGNSPFLVVNDSVAENLETLADEVNSLVEVDTITAVENNNSGGNNVVTITLSDGNSTTFNVKNGIDGVDLGLLLLVQATGTATDAVMSLKATTDLITKDIKVCECVHFGKSTDNYFNLTNLLVSVLNNTDIISIRLVILTKGTESSPMRYFVLYGSSANNNYTNGFHLKYDYSKRLFASNVNYNTTTCINKTSGGTIINPAVHTIIWNKATGTIKFYERSNLVSTQLNDAWKLTNFIYTTNNRITLYSGDNDSLLYDLQIYDWDISDLFSYNNVGIRQDENVAAGALYCNSVYDGNLISGNGQWINSTVSNYVNGNGFTVIKTNESVDGYKHLISVDSAVSGSSYTWSGYYVGVSNKAERWETDVEVVSGEVSFTSGGGMVPLTIIDSNNNEYASGTTLGVGTYTLKGASSGPGKWRVTYISGLAEVIHKADRYKLISCVVHIKGNMLIGNSFYDELADTYYSVPNAGPDGTPFDTVMTSTTYAPTFVGLRAISGNSIYLADLNYSWVKVN